LHGAVVGGGLEIAAATHVRVADETTFYALPEGQRGIFVGGGGSVRIARLIGAVRMTDMMLTARSLDAAEGYNAGISQYTTAAGGSLEKAKSLAAHAATNAPLANYAIINALPRIQDMSQEDGLFVESLMASIASAAPEAQSRLRDFLEGRAARLEPKRDGS
jgi:enoyl-CoA hydratase/carnithine racemase